MRRGPPNGVQPELVNRSLHLGAGSTHSVLCLAQRIKEKAVISEEKHVREQLADALAETMTTGNAEPLTKFLTKHDAYVTRLSRSEFQVRLALPGMSRYLSVKVSERY